jgi:hypothetical protein
MRPQPLISVTDVPTSSRWYQRLLGCVSDHGGEEYERLLHDGTLVLQLHHFDGPDHRELPPRDPDGYLVVAASPTGESPWPDHPVG